MASCHLPHWLGVCQTCRNTICSRLQRGASRRASIQVDPPNRRKNLMMIARLRNLTRTSTKTMSLPHLSCAQHEKFYSSSSMVYFSRYLDLQRGQSTVSFRFPFHQSNVNDYLKSRYNSDRYISCDAGEISNPPFGVHSSLTLRHQI